MRFEYLEIQPCRRGTDGIGGDHIVTVDDPKEADFWTLYGRDEEGLAVAIGDFGTREGALEVLNAILAPMAKARDELDAGRMTALVVPELATKQANARGANIRTASATLDDFINQSSNEERL